MQAVVAPVPKRTIEVEHVPHSQRSKAGSSVVKWKSSAQEEAGPPVKQAVVNVQPVEEHQHAVISVGR